MADDATGPDPFDQFDDDMPWVVQVDDEHMSILPPHAALEALTQGLSEFARSPHQSLELSIDDDGQPRHLSHAELTEITSACADTVSYFLQRGGIGDEALEALGEAAATLHTIGEFDLEVRFADNDPSTGDRAMWVDAIAHLATDCASMLFARFRPRRDGTFSLRWRPADRDLIAHGSSELRRLLTSDDPAIARLFPPAYGDDADRNAAWNILERSELIERRIQALDTVASLMDAKRATAEELSALMRTVNDARLVFGTQLDVTDDGPPADLNDADRALFMVYELLGQIVYEAVIALRSTL